ncbi:urea ABC transporter permease subunit UrtC [Alteribacillus sp. HJP-4]|uniref:urea ABC transporter permease subunit UrtC n=1 Tax=Alteribacillus sp. HJP-4 TaxID=2775394 RepID=UPI0035CD2816
MSSALKRIAGSQKNIFIIMFLVLLILPLFLSDFHTNLLGRYLSFAILVIGLNLLWGYAGVLSLGHGIFFGIGAYVMAMYVTMESSGGGLPDFMVWNGVTELPFIWSILSSPFAAVPLGILFPMALAFLIGFFTFRNRIRGVYFTILTQALVIVTVTLIVSQQNVTGGSNGLTGFRTVFGFSLASPFTVTILYFVTLAFLGLIFWLSCRLVNSRFGNVLVAIRDGENRLRFSGYNTAYYKIFIFTLSAGIAGLAGMLFVLQVGIISPSMIDIVPSIEMILWVAIGGRGTLLGPIFGALLANSGKTFFSQTYPDFWLFLIGAVFIIVVVFLPGGLMSIGTKIKQKWGRSHVRAKDEETGEEDKKNTAV